MLTFIDSKYYILYNIMKGCMSMNYTIILNTIVYDRIYEYIILFIN